MSFLGEYATARQAQQGIGTEERAMARTRLADTAATNARMEALKKADADRRYAAQGLPPEYSMSGTMEPGQAAPTPGAQMAPGDMGAYVPRRSPTAPPSTGTGADSNAIMVSEANRRLQSMRRNAPTREQVDQASLMQYPAAAADIFTLPVTATRNALGGLASGAQNAAGTVVNAVAGRKILDTNKSYGDTALTPYSDRYVTPTFEAAARPGIEEQRLKQLQGREAPAAPTPSVGASVAERNNNPGNLKFAGQAGARPGPVLPDGTRFAVFDTPEAGMAANVNQLRIYGARGVNTVEKIINTWSPGNAQGNTPQSTSNYIAHVSRALGVAPNQPLDMSNPQVLQAIAQAQAPFESGAGSVPQQGQTAVAATTQQPTAPQGTPGAVYGGQGDPQALQRQLADTTRQYQYLQERMGIESDDAKRQQILTQMDAVKSAHIAAQTGFAYQTGNLPALVNIANSMGIPVGLQDAGNGQVIAVAQGRQSQPMDRAAAAQWLYGQVDAQQRAADAKRQESYRAAEQSHQFAALLEREKGTQTRETEMLKGVKDFELKAMEAGIKANEIKFERLDNGGVVAVVRGQMYMVPTGKPQGGGADKFGGAVASPLQPVSFAQ